MNFMIRAYLKATPLYSVWFVKVIMYFYHFFFLFVFYVLLKLEAVIKEKKM